MAMTAAMAAANMQPIKTFVIDEARSPIDMLWRETNLLSCQAIGRGRRTRRYPCAAASFLSQQSVASLGYLREPSGVHATVRILRFSRSAHVCRANARI